MDQGFTPDSKQNGPRVNEWIEGAPKKAWFGFVKVRGLRALPIETWRCGRCGFLESYAPGP